MDDFRSCAYLNLPHTRLNIGMLYTCRQERQRYLLLKKKDQAKEKQNEIEVLVIIIL